MKKINEIIVVEGKSDKQFLETFINADIFTCNGSAIDGFDKEYLIKLANTRGVIILTDPDYPGEKIRKELQSYLPVCKHAFVQKEKSIKHHKVGVAESTQEEVLNALKNVITFKQENKGNLSLSNLVNLRLCGPNSFSLKQKVQEFYHLGYCNTKTFLKRLNLLNITYEELEKLVYDLQ